MIRYEEQNKNHYIDNKLTDFLSMFDNLEDILDKFEIKSCKFFIQHVYGKLNRIKKVRKKRLECFEQNKKFNEDWENIFFVYNILATILVSLSIFGSSCSFFIENNKFNSIVGIFFSIASSIVSLYIILLQNYISKRDFSGRCDRFYNNQLSLKRCIEDIRSLLINMSFDFSEEINEFKYNKNINMCNKFINIFREYEIKSEQIFERYHEIISFTENHNEQDSEFLRLNDELERIESNIIRYQFKLSELNKKKQSENNNQQLKKLESNIDSVEKRLQYFLCDKQILLEQLKKYQFTDSKIGSKKELEEYYFNNKKEKFDISLLRIQNWIMIGIIVLCCSYFIFLLFVFFTL